jgi:NAD-dependent SIR2 family protein deacetylase
MEFEGFPVKDLFDYHKVLCHISSVDSPWIDASTKMGGQVRLAHNKYMSTLAKLAIQATPTKFHKFLQLLHNCGILRRLYTQNIDGLEAKVGFDVFSTEKNQKCVLLHRCVGALRCDKCGAVVMIENYLTYFDHGEAVPCPGCIQKQDEDSAADKRVKTAGSLQPDILLYNQPCPDGEEIWDIASRDANALKHNHVLLICGTSLQIPGIKSIIKEFKTAMLQGTRRGCRIIYIDISPHPPANLKDICQHVQMDCQEFATIAISIIEGLKQDNDPTQIVSRRDFRPIWHWN